MRHTLRAGEAFSVEAEAQSPTTIANGGPSTVYYGTPTVSTSSYVGSIASGAQVTISTTRWLASAERSELNIEFDSETASTPPSTGDPHVLRSRAPLNALDYATGNGTTDDHAELQTLCDNINSGGRGETLFLPNGTYKCLSSLDLGQYVSLQGDSRRASKLYFPTDLGAGEYAVATSNAESQRFPAIRDLHIQGLERPASPAAGVTPANMYGVQCLNGWTLENLYVSGFKAGIAISGNHQRVRQCYVTNNYYGLYWVGTPTSLGDIEVIGCNLDGNTFASIGISPDQIVDGCTFLSCHTGYGPYCIYKETGGTQPAMLYKSVFVDCAFESWAHGAIKAQTNANIIACTFVSCAGSGAFDAAVDFQISGATEYASIDVGTGTVSLLRLLGGTHPFLGAGTQGVMKGSFSFCDLGQIDYELDQAVTAGVPYFAAGSGVEGLHARYGGAECRAMLAGNAVARYDAVEQLHTETCQKGGTTSPFVPAGVALHAAASSEYVIVANSGRTYVNDGNAITGANKILVLDSTNDGKVREYVHASDQPWQIMGVSTNASDGTKCRAWLRGLT